jgi:hypothetical protein
MIMKTSCPDRAILFTALLVITISLSVATGDPAKTKTAPTPSLAGRLFQLPDGMEWAESQKETIQLLIEDYEPKLAGFQQEILNITTKEQREARAAAFRQKRGNAKTGLSQADAESAMELTEAQKKTFADVQNRKNAVKREALRRFKAVLTPDQLAEIEAQAGNRKRLPKGR